MTFARRVVVRTRQIGLARAAGSLAFTTLLGIVPLATVALEFVARFPVFEQWLDALETFLLKHMLPESANAVVNTHIREFTEKAAGLTGLSIVFIVVTATMLIATAEREINALWASRAGGPSRGGFRLRRRRDRRRCSSARASRCRHGSSSNRSPRCPFAAR
jgi:membrane protein